MQVNVIYALKPEKLHNMQYKSLKIYAAKSKNRQNMHYARIYSPKVQNMQNARKKYQYLESLSHQTYICKV